MTGISMLGFDGVMDALDYDSFGSEEYRVGTNVEYAIFVEYGTSRNQAQPYLRPAVEEVLSDIDQIANRVDSPEELVERLALEIEAVAKKNAPVDSGNLRGSITAERL